MTVFTYVPIADGTTGDVADINGPFSAIANSLNGNIDATNIAAGSITATQLASNVNPTSRYAEQFSNFIVSGCTIGTSATLATTVAAGVAYINGVRITPLSTPRSYTASKDTYVDLKSDGSYAYVEVANNATSGMTLSTNTDGSNAIRIAKVVTSGTAVVQVLQGAFNVAPVSPNTLNWYGFDPLGNAVYQTSANPTLLGYTKVASGGTLGATVHTGVAPLTYIAPANSLIRVTGFANYGDFNTSQNSSAQLTVKDGTDTVADGYGWLNGATAGSNNVQPKAIDVYSPVAGPRSLSLSMSLGPGAYQMSGWTNAVIIVERVR